MTLIEKILTKLFRLETVEVEGLYLRRWHLLELSGRGTFYLHCFVSGDKDRDPHDHPFGFWTFVLKGVYYDCEYDSNRKIACIDNMNMFTIRKRKPTHLHRVILPIDKDGNSKKCWTFIWRSKKVRPWGFLTKDGWVHHKKYIEKNSFKND